MRGAASSVGSSENYFEVLRRSPFFEGLNDEHVRHFADRARMETFEAEDLIIEQGAYAASFYVLAGGKIELSFAERSAQAARRQGPDGRSPSHIVGLPGHPIGWASVVEPPRYRATATALERTEMLVLDRTLFEEYAGQRPDFGLAFMRRVLWLMANHLQTTRARLIATRTGDLPRMVGSLLEQNASALSVASPLHKVPHYLKDRLTVDDARRAVELLQRTGDETERELAAQISGLLDEAWREVAVFKKLQGIYDLVAGAPSTMSPSELRRRSCEAFADMFEDTRNLIAGEDNLPDTAGHVFVMNHLSNHTSNLLPNDFILTLDTHFVSSVILLKKYGEAPVRVVRKSDAGEHGHQRFYDRLGYIYVYSEQMDPAADDDPLGPPEERRRLFLDTARDHLLSGRNIVICPEGTSASTERSPLPFRSGAFWLASYVRPEPLIVPVAVANFDKRLTRTRTVAVVHEPIRLSEHVGDPPDPSRMREFVDKHIFRGFQEFVREAERLGR